MKRAMNRVESGTDANLSRAEAAAREESLWRLFCPPIFESSKRTVAVTASAATALTAKTAMSSQSFRVITTGGRRPKAEC